MDYTRFGEYQPSERRNATTAVTFLLVGAAVGAVAALLMSPTTGKKMRKQVRRTYEDARERFGDRFDEWGERAADMWENRDEWAETARSAAKKVAPFVRRMGKEY